MKTPTPTAPRAGTPRLVLSRGMKVAVAGLSVMPLVGALADGVLSWGETTALVIIVLVAIGVVFVGLTRILIGRLNRSRASVARKGFSRALRVMTASLILGYVALVAGLTLYGDDLPWFLWIALVVWVIGMLGLTILQSRAENLRSEKARPRAEFGFYTSMFVSASASWVWARRRSASPSTRSAAATCSCSRRWAWRRSHSPSSASSC